MTQVSIVLCTYNSLDTLGLALDSALSQGLSSEDYEVIVIDDGSTDDTAVVGRVRGMINEASDARLGPRSSPRVARRLNGFDSEIDYTLEALKVVEVKASPRGSPHCMRKDDTIAAECFIK